MPTYEELKAAHEAAQLRLRELDDSPERKAALKVARDAAGAFYAAERVERGREMAQSIIGQRIVAVVGPREQPESHDHRFDVGTVIILENGVEIEAEGSDDDCDARLLVTTREKGMAS